MKLNREQRRVQRRSRSWLRLVEIKVKRRPYHHAERCVLESLKRCDHGQARIYAGDLKLAGPVGRRDAKGRKLRWTRGEPNFCSPITIWRGKTRLERAGVLHLTHTRGGFTRNPQGELVRAATGYEADPELYSREPLPPPAPAAAVRPVPAEMSAEARLWAERAGLGGRDGP